MGTDMLALARAAIDSHEHRLVLADLIEETGWWDPRIKYDLSNGDDRDEFLSLLTWPGEMGQKHARVVVAALTRGPNQRCLGCGEYSDDVWPNTACSAGNGYHGHAFVDVDARGMAVPSNSEEGNKR